jgi:hypothetical protein
MRLAATILGALAAALMAAADSTTIEFADLKNTLSDYYAIPNGYDSFAANTPDIAVSYSTNYAIDGTCSSSVLVTFVSFWLGQYGDLPAVAYPMLDGYYAVISLTPNPGYDVTLESFRIAGYPTGDRSESDQSISVDNAMLQPYPGADYSDYRIWNSGYRLFTPDITSTGTLNIVFGPNWDIGIDDITFSEQYVGLSDAANSIFLLGAAILALACFSKVFTAALRS